MWLPKKVLHSRNGEHTFVTGALATEKADALSPLNGDVDQLDYAESISLE